MAAASDLEPAFVELGRRFSAAGGAGRGQQVVFSFASSSVLAQQVQKGAPFDLFAAANAELVERLVASGRIVPGSARPYARGQLVVYTARGTPPPAAIHALAAPGYARIALANPEHAPYGQAAVQALRSAGLLDELARKRRLIYGENVRQAHQYVETGNADAALGALALAAAGDGGSYVVIPASLYAPLVQVLGVVAGGDAAGAARFVELLQSAEGQSTLQRHGFLPVPVEPEVGKKSSDGTDGNRTDR